MTGPLPTDEPNGPSRPRYIWPWFVLGGVLLGILLSVFWLSREIERMRRIRDLNAPPPGSATNSAR